MIVTRYINGVEVSDEGMKNYKIVNPEVLEIINRVMKRVNQQAEQSRKEVA